MTVTKSLQGPGAVKRVSRRVPSEGDRTLIDVRVMDPGKPFLKVIEPTVAGVDLEGWVSRHGEKLEELLASCGALLFRGFGIDTVDGFQSLMGVMTENLVEYTYRSTPRTQVTGRVYTSTEYPADQSIPFHNEHSYASSWPLKLWFGCIVPSETGGETPIADSRRVYELLPESVRRRFEDEGVLYVRNYGSGFDLSWQEVFDTEDRGQVEAFCRQAGLEFEWQGSSQLRTRQVCQAVAQHPKSGEALWFNQAHLFHVSNMEPEIRELMEMEFGEDNLPRNTYYGGGAPIEDEVLEQIREAYRQASVSFPWQAGDVLMLDNMLVAHSRAPFTGKRQVVVGMADEYSAASV